MIKNNIAVIGGGCFWCLEAVLQRIKGVDNVVSGYAGKWIAKQVAIRLIQPTRKYALERQTTWKCAK